MLDDPTRLKNNDVIRVRDCCKPMRDDDHRPVLGIGRQRTLERALTTVTRPASEGRS